MNAGRRPILRWLWAVVAVGVAGGGCRLTPAERDECEARSVLQRLEAAQQECIRREGAPYIRDVAGLHAPRGLVPAEIAAADGSPATPPARWTPYRGYYFHVVLVPSEGLQGRHGRFAYCAYPVSRDAGQGLCLVEGHPIFGVGFDQLWPPDAILREQYAKPD